jgi:hypothetical protein
MHVGRGRLGANSVLALTKRSSQRVVPHVQVFGRIRLSWPTRSRIHVFRVGALRNALVLQPLLLCARFLAPAVVVLWPPKRPLHQPQGGA